MQIELDDVLDGPLPETDSPCAQQVNVQPPALTPFRPERRIDLEEILDEPLSEHEFPFTPPSKARRLPAPPAFIPAASANPRVARAFFNVTDLFDKIVFRLPEKDVLLVQRVFRQFKTNIQGLEILQRKLFFRQRFKNTPAVRPNPFLVRRLLTKRPFNALRPAIALRDGTWKLILLHCRDRLRESRGKLIFLDFKDWTFCRTHAASPGKMWPLLLRFKIAVPGPFAVPAALQSERRSGRESWKRMYFCDSPRAVMWEVKNENWRTAGDTTEHGTPYGELVAHGVIYANSTLGDLVEVGSDWE